MANNQIVRGKDDPVSAFQKLMERHKGALDKALARNLPADRLIRIACNALHRTPNLQNCSLPSIVNSVVLCGVMGLEPNTPLQHAFLIPYGKECTFQPGYRGLMSIARRTAHVKRWRSELVHPGDEFEIEYGMNEKFSHRPGDQSEPWVKVYSFLWTPDDETAFVVMNKAEVLHIRDTRSVGYQRGKATSPWTTDEGEMAKKTVIKRHCKTLDLSVEVAQAATLDDQAETDGKQESFIEAEFRDLSEQAEDAQGSLAAGSVAEQDQVAEKKIYAMGGGAKGTQPTAENGAGENPRQGSRETEGGYDFPPADLPNREEWPDDPTDQFYKVKGTIFVFDEPSGNYRHYVSQAPQQPKRGITLGGKR